MRNFLILCVFCGIALASFEMHAPNVKFMGRGRWAVADIDEFCENCVVLPYNKRLEVGSGNFYGISEISQGFCSFALPLKNFSFAMRYSFLKFSNVYREDFSSFNFSRRITDKFFTGINLNLYGLRISNFEEGLNRSISSTDFDIGFVWRAKFFALGASLFSANSKEIIFKRISEKNSSQIKAGFVLMPFEKTKMGFDFEKDGFNAGVETEIAQALKTSFGISKGNLTFGFSIRLPVLWLNFSTIVNDEIGNVYFFSMSNE
ncbi:MAG: hypothetical protein J7L42_02880 [Elusimicrobia bacterium]|nr:hypothetical protein [Elusimicrobiota bacterium]